MTRSSLPSELKRTIADLLEITDFPDDAHLARDLGADSMMLEELVVRIERRYKVKFPNAELRNIVTLSDVVRVVERLQSPGGLR